MISDFIFDSLEDKLLVKMSRALRSLNAPSLTTEEFSLLTKDSKQNLSGILSSLSSLLRLLSVQCLDLTECKSEALSLTTLFGLQEPLTIRSVSSSVGPFLWVNQPVSQADKCCSVCVCSGSLKRLFSSLFHWCLKHRMMNWHTLSWRRCLKIWPPAHWPGNRFITCCNIKLWIWSWTLERAESPVKTSKNFCWC